MNKTTWNFIGTQGCVVFNYKILTKKKSSAQVSVEILTLTPVTKISFRQFSAVSCVHRWASTHQSHGNCDDTHCVQDKWVEQSKNVNDVETKSGPFIVRTDNLAVKWSKVLKIFVLIINFKWKISKCILKIVGLYVCQVQFEEEDLFGELCNLLHSVSLLRLYKWSVYQQWWKHKPNFL